MAYSLLCQYKNSSKQHGTTTQKATVVITCIFIFEGFGQEGGTVTFFNNWTVMLQTVFGAGKVTAIVIDVILTTTWKGFFTGFC